MTEIAFWIMTLICIGLSVAGSIYYIKANNERRIWVDRYYHTMKYAIKHLKPEELRELEEQLRELGVD